MENKTGKAYAFFDCEAPKEEIDEELPYIRDAVKTPNTLELSLIEGSNKDLSAIAKRASEESLLNEEYDLITSAIKNGKDSTKNIPRFIRLANRIDIGKGSGARYVMEATYPNATNSKTADELASILRQVYQSPLHQERERFRGEVIYEDDERYLFRD